MEEIAGRESREKEQGGREESRKESSKDEKLWHMEMQKIDRMGKVQSVIWWEKLEG